MKKYLMPLLVMFCLVLYSCASAATGKSSIPASVNRYLLRNGTDFRHYKISDVDSGEEFGYNEKSYNVYEDLETVWHDYRRTDPARAFDSSIIDFGIMYNPEDSAVYSSDDPYLPRFSEGQIYILNLKFMGIYSFPVGFKVSRIDSEKKMIEFIYLKNNIANGFQRIYLKPDHDSSGNPVTHIEHYSYFTSEYHLRDKLIYPPFHQQTIDDFHENVFRLNGLAWDKL